jgi:hypothetical protein
MPSSLADVWETAEVRFAVTLQTNWGHPHFYFWCMAVEPSDVLNVLTCEGAPSLKGELLVF